MNAAGLALLKHFEGCRLEAYRDSGNVITIGWGFTGYYPDTFSYRPGDPVEDSDAITQEQADILLSGAVEGTEHALAPSLPSWLNDNQRAALTCLAYNVGAGAVANSRLLGKVLVWGKNQSTMGHSAHPEVVLGLAFMKERVAADWLSWDHARVHGLETELPSLKARRQAEWELFCSPINPVNPS